MTDRHNKPNITLRWSGQQSRKTDGNPTTAAGSTRSPQSHPWQKRHIGSSKLSAHNTNSNDTVRKIVQEEGRSARNLITWSVPLQNGDRPPPQRKSRCLYGKNAISKPSASNPVLEKTEESDSLDSGKKQDIRARYWAFLFDNLERAVDEIYKTCEGDESEVQCKEAIMMLEQSSRDFSSLIERLKVIRDFENAQTRPTSLAWEVRKTSPGKIMSSVVPERLMVAANKRILTFTKPSAHIRAVNCAVPSSVVTYSAPSRGTGSYADRVRGIPMEPKEKDCNSVTNFNEVNIDRPSTLLKSISLDVGEGWETVQNRRHRNKTNGRTRSAETFTSNNLKRRRPSPLVEQTEAFLVTNPDARPFLSTIRYRVGNESSTRFSEEGCKIMDRVGSMDDDDDDDDDDDADEMEDIDDDFVKIEDQLYNELEVVNEALEEEQALEMNDIEDAVTEQMNKEHEEAMTEEAGTQTSLKAPQVMAWEGLVEAYQVSHHLSWGEIVDVEERTPGRSVQMHEKLSSPSRKPSTRELSKKYEEKQLKAQHLREKLRADRAERLRELVKKVEIVTQMKEELGEQRRDTIEQKMRAAEEKRNLELKKRMQKAHDEEAKANEIAFINSLEAQNKKHEIETKHQECQARLLDIAEERQRKNDEKAAKEAAVEERRRALDADRVARLQEMQERRRQRETEFEQRQLEKEKERLVVARAKEKDREERIAALKAQQQSQIEELRAKIREKQDESARRHNEKLDQIREKAFEMTILRHSTEDHSDAPKLTPYDKKKLCLVCNVLLPSEVHLSSHLRGKKHQQSMVGTSSIKNMTKTDIEEFNLTNIKDAPSDRPDLQLKNDKERHKALKKRCKKLRQRMSACSTESDNFAMSNHLNSRNKQILERCVKDINKVYVPSKGKWTQERVLGLERVLFEVGRILDENCPRDRESFCAAGGMTSICWILLNTNDSSEYQLLPNKTTIACASTLKSLCVNNFDICHYMLFSNKLSGLIDLVASRFPLQRHELQGMFNSINDQVTTALIHTVVTAIVCLTDLADNPNKDYRNRINDIISYLVSVGLFDRISVIFSSIGQPVENNTKAIDYLVACLKLIEHTIELVAFNRNQDLFEEPYSADHTLLIPTLTSTEICSTISLLYSFLLNTSSNTDRHAIPTELCKSTMLIAVHCMELLNAVARLNVPTFQNILGGEGTWLEFRHICSYLLWYCAHFSSENLLHQVIVCVGFFTVLCPDNQLYIQSGQSPTVLQQLCSLPFPYFSNSKLAQILLPTLIACTYKNRENRQILENELNCAVLANFIEDSLKAPKNENTSHSLKFWNRFPLEHFESAIIYYRA